MQTIYRELHTITIEVNPVFYLDFEQIVEKIIPTKVKRPRFCYIVYLLDLYPLGCISKMKTIVQITTICFLICLASYASGHGQVSGHLHVKQKGSVTYLGNEAVMVKMGDTKILFDPFFHSDFGIYQLVPKLIKSDIHQGRAPYDNISIILISHAHADHFAEDEVIRFLQKHQQVSLIGPKQAVDALLKLLPDNNVRKRLYAIELNLKESAKELVTAGMLVEAVRIPHAGWPNRSEIENIVYRVSLNSEPAKLSNTDKPNPLTVIHMGDADPKLSHYTPHRAHWESKQTDLAFPPYWFYGSEEGQSIISQTINTVKSIGLHVPKEVPSGLKQSGFDYFSTPGETREFSQEIATE